MASRSSREVRGCLAVRRLAVVSHRPPLRRPPDQPRPADCLANPDAERPPVLQPAGDAVARSRLPARRPPASSSSSELRLASAPRLHPSARGLPVVPSPARRHACGHGQGGARSWGQGAEGGEVEGRGAARRVSPSVSLSRGGAAPPPRPEDPNPPCPPRWPPKPGEEPKPAGRGSTRLREGSARRALRVATRLRATAAAARNLPQAGRSLLRREMAERRRQALPAPAALPLEAAALLATRQTT